jgi:hypothetical protein
MNSERHLIPTFAFLGLSTVVGWAGCGGASKEGLSDSGGDDDAGMTFQQMADPDSGVSSAQLVLTEDGGIATEPPCSNGSATTISGKIFDPAGKNALYGAVAYVPSTPLTPLKSGPSCDSCASLYTGTPVAIAQTDATGHFVMNNAVSGKNVPVVVQLGKWRRQVTIPTVTACQDNPVADGTLKLPNNHTVGNIPNIAISTGGADTLECLLSRMGVDATEYEPGAAGPGRVHIFQGSGAGGFTIPIMIPGLNLAGVGAPNTNPAGPSSSSALWDSAAHLDAYDIIMLSCEGSPTANLSDASLAAMAGYANMGGRVFASHYHYAWFTPSGPFATYKPAIANWTPDDDQIGNINAVIETTLPGGAAFPKGAAMKEWLGNVNALGVSATQGGPVAPAGELPIVAARHDANVTAANTPSTSWIVPDAASKVAAGASEYFSFNTPLGGSSEQECGRVVYSDLHVGGASSDDPTKPVPQECSTANLTPQEKALEFMLFDLSSCVVPDSMVPPPPTIVPK